MKIDLAIAGLPCKAYSALRVKSGQGDQQGAAMQHPAHSVVEEFVEYVAKRRPGVFWVEEVEGFAFANPDLAKKGVHETYLTTWSKKLVAFGILHSCGEVRPRSLRRHAQATIADIWSVAGIRRITSCCAHGFRCDRRAYIPKVAETTGCLDAHRR